MLQALSSLQYPRAGITVQGDSRHHQALRPFTPRLGVRGRAQESLIVRGRPPFNRPPRLTQFETHKGAAKETTKQYKSKKKESLKK